MERLISRRGFHRLALSAARHRRAAAAGVRPGLSGTAHQADCPWPAGGATDAVMRAIAESAGKALGGQIRGGEQGGCQRHAGPQRARQGAAGRLHAVAAHIGIARLPHMQKMQFDPLKDFTYVLT